jgi:hypothetical protein
MSANKLWMIGCIGFAGLSAYLAANAMGFDLQGTAVNGVRSINF